MLDLTKDCIASFFDRARATLGKTPEMIYSIFPDAEFNLLKIDRKTRSVLEVNTPYFTLSCHMNDKNRCTSALVFINRQEELEIAREVIDYFNRHFPYSFLMKMWIMDELSIDIRPVDECLMFSISKLEYLTSDFIKCLTLEGFISSPH